MYSYQNQSAVSTASNNECLLRYIQQFSSSMQQPSCDTRFAPFTDPSLPSSGFNYYKAFKEAYNMVGPVAKQRCSKRKREESDYSLNSIFHSLKMNGTKKIKIHDKLFPQGGSLTEIFTAQQIKAHLCSLNSSTDLESDGKITAPNVGTDTCQLCIMDGLSFTAPAISCASCGASIMHNNTYYWSKDDATSEKYCCCTKCFKGSRVTISFGECIIPKADLTKDNNSGALEEWVQCDKCKQWNHQICALYNKELDSTGDAKYTCPFCRLAEIEANELVLIYPPSSEAHSLPRTELSDHIEQRLLRSLEQERIQSQEVLGVGALDLTVRVVLDVNKLLKVNKQFLDILPKKTYPTEFPYQSKVILLFQKIDGVDVCLFVMYVQEFGSECSGPNKHSVYISYLDSVKYFTPEVKCSTGVALRSFVYHEILIGYLDYCKKRGFETCYIWACPSSKGDDYILNCHPQDQRTPSSNKLIQWYKQMINKAKSENVVVGLTNFYEHFFHRRGGRKSKISAAQLPYFDGAYWSTAAEEIMQTLNSEEKSNGRLRSNKTFRANRQNKLSADTSKDALVMEKLGQNILHVKEAIMVIQLQANCTNCNKMILSRGYWSCDQCNKFHLCSRCVPIDHTHVDIHGEEHPLSLIRVEATTVDNVGEGNSGTNIFDDRQSFLSFCETNNFQFDSLRRAKHSSMMILHHLQRATRNDMMKKL